MTLVIGIVSYGMMLTFRQAISQGAAEGARAAAVSADPVARYTDAVSALDSALKSYGVTCTGIPAAGGTGSLKKGATTVGVCTIAEAACGTNSCVNVTLNYNYKHNAIVPPMPGLGIFLPKKLIYTASARVS